MEFRANDWRSVLPEGWEDRSLITIVGATGPSGIAANIVVTREPVDARTSIEEYAAQQKQVSFEQFPDLEVLDERATRLNGAPAYQRLQRIGWQNRTLQQAQTFVLGRGAVYVITCTAAVDEFNAAIPAFRQFTENFLLEER